MSQCGQCEHNGYRYEFSTSTTDFNFAKQLCENNGGTLARYLDEDAYLEIRKYCQNGLLYWIGLSENRLCSSSPVEPYKWVSDTTCTSGSPLNIIQLPNSAQNSQAVAILLNSNNLATPPEAKELYDYETHRYICQYSPITFNPTAPYTPTTSVITSLGTTIQQSSAATTTTSSTWPTTTGSENPFHNISYAALIGIIIGMAVLICLLAGGLALYCYCKKRNSLSDDKENTENHVTIKLSETKTQESEKPNAPSNQCK